MVSPLQQRKQRIARMVVQQHTATVCSGDTQIEPIQRTDSNEWDLVRASISKDEAALKSFRSIDDKVSYKTRCMEQYEPYIGRKNIPLDIAAILMVWLFDTQKIGDAVSLGQYCIKYGASMPPRFKSGTTVEIFIADSVLSWAENAFKNNESVSPFFDDTLHLIESEWETYDQIPAKYYKLSGFMALGKYGTEIKHVPDPEQLYAAKAWFEKAQKKYDKIGVGTRINDIDKRLKKLNLPLVAED